MLTLDLPRDQLAPTRARAALDQLDGLPEDTLAQAKLLVSELVTNSVKYGSGGPVHLEISRPDDTGLRVDVAGEGESFIPHARSRPATDVGGWGLYLVDSLAERWGVQDGTSAVWFELGSTAAAAA